MGSSGSPARVVSTKGGYIVELFGFQIRGAWVTEKEAEAFAETVRQRVAEAAIFASAPTHAPCPFCTIIGPGRWDPVISESPIEEVTALVKKAAESITPRSREDIVASLKQLSKRMVLGGDEG